MFEIIGVAGPLDDGELPRTASVRPGDVEFEARVRIDTPKEAEYFRHGGILPYVLRQLLSSTPSRAQALAKRRAPRPRRRAGGGARARVA